MKIKALLLACVLLINPVWASAMEDDEDNKHIVSMEFTKHPELVDIDFIVYFPSLQRLRVEDCPQLQDNYHWVSHLRNLTHLVLSNIKLTTLVPLEGLSSLVSLNVAFNRLTTIKGIENLPNLIDLNLFGNSRLQSFDLISGLTRLEKLNLGNIFDEASFSIESSHFVRTASNLEFVLPLINLRTLRLYGNDFIRSFKILGSLPALNHLDLDGIAEVKDSEYFASFPSLRKITIRESLSIAPLPSSVTIIRKKE